MKKTLLGLATAMLFSVQANASIDVSNGKVTINVSGADANQWGESGSSAGSADITLSYEDAAKTMVLISGTTVRFGKTANISQRIALKDLRSIVIYAVGGSGANGYPGSSGSNGRDGEDGRQGWPGSDGCPPSSGQRGSDGGNGSDGTDGRDGGDAGNGGRGGTIKVSTSPDQSELMMFVKTATGGGEGGSGGAGGSGGRGGRAGQGGAGGRGGRNTCKDEKGNPKWGPDGSDGWKGSDGRAGRDGRSGSWGRSGSGGRSGSRSFNLVDANGTQTFTGIFDLQLSDVKFVDDTGDEILQPGERVYLKSLKLNNKGAMPSPANQTIRLTVLPSKTALVPAVLSASSAPVAALAAAPLEFKKGVLTLQVPADKDLIGKKVTTTIRVSINNVSFDVEADTGMAIRWPVTLSAASTNISTSFEVPKVMNFTLKNAGSSDLGPNGSQPVFLGLSWSSKTIPGEEVSVVMPDGTEYKLDKSVVVSDLTVPFKNTLALPLTLKIRDRKLLANGSGVLNVSVRLQDMNAANEVIVQSIAANISARLDINALAWDQNLDLAGLKVQCQFPNLATPTQPMASVDVKKASGSDKLQIQLTVPGTTRTAVSPVITVSASKMLAAYYQFSSTWTAQNVVDFLNQIVSPNSPRGVWQFKSCSVAP